MSDTPKVEQWHYPFTSAHKSSFEHLAAMAKARSGFYPIGANGIWHGGVHFDSGTAGAYQQNDVRCITDGEVVAYRIDTQYPQTQYIERRASFSTGFVLVRHRLEIPPTSGGANVTGGPSLTFFSLYMHLRDWAGYEADSALARPAFWEAVSEYEVATQETPLSMRRLPNPNGEEVARLPKGTLISVGANDGDFCEVLTVISGTASAELNPLSADSPRLGWVASRLLKPRGLPSPHSQDAVVVLAQPVPVKAGELIGHLGEYQQPTQAAPEALVHLEVFSCDDVSAFMAKSKAYGYQLPSAQKSVLKVAKGERLVPHHPSFTATNPPNRYADNALTIGVDLMVPQSYLDSLPPTHKITQRMSASNGSNMQWVIHWWRLENLVPDESGNPISGWFAEQDLLTTRHSPWEWEGFQCIKETGTTVEMHAYAFNAKGLLTADEKENFRAQINKADEGPIVGIARLHNMIDTDGDGVLSASEIRAALEKPWQAQVLAQLVTHYESEWFWSSKWDELDELMQHTPVEPDKQWLASKARIQKLSWWADVASVAGISADGKAWHFHPLGAIGLHTKECPQSCRSETYEFSTTIGNYTVSKKLFNYILETEQYQKKPYTLPDETSGITLGYGYDLGHQTTSTIESELSGLYTATEIETLKTALGKKGAAARAHLQNVIHIEISQDKAVQLALRMKQRYAQAVVNIYPESITLHPDCQGALLSLIINRGAALKYNDAGDTSRIEMRQIKEDLRTNKPELVPSRLRAMKRLWETNPNQRGLITRREKEAAFFEKALTCKCWR